MLTKPRNPKEQEIPTTELNLFSLANPQFYENEICLLVCGWHPEKALEQISFTRGMANWPQAEPELSVNRLGAGPAAEVATLEGAHHHQLWVAGRPVLVDFLAFVPQPFHLEVSVRSLQFFLFAYFCIFPESWGPLCSVEFSRSVASNSLWPHGLQHARLPCPSPTSRLCSNSCPLSQWCHPTISSSVIPFSSCLQSFPASGSFPMSQFFTSGVQSIGASASASVLPINI